MRVLREVLARFGIEFDGQGLLAARGGLVALAAAAAAAAVAIGAALFDALRDATIETIELGVETQRTADTLGLSIQSVQEWGFAASRAGRGVEEITDAMSTLQERARDALIDPASDPAQQLRLLGVSARDAQGELRGAEDLFLAVADGLAGMSSQTDRVGAAMTLFGDVGRDLLPVLQDGSAGIEELRERARELGGGLSAEVAANAAEASAAMADFEFATVGLRSTLVADIIPTVTIMVTGVADLVGAFNRATRRTHPLRAILLGLGIAIGSVAAAVTLVLLPALAPLLLIFGAWAAAIAIVVLAVDDLLTLFEGGDSVIGRFLDAMFGVGTAAEVAEAARLAWADFVRWVEAEAIPVVMAIGRTLVGLWPLMRVGLRAIGRFIAAPFRFLAALPGLVRSAFESIVSLFDAISERVSSAVASWMSGLDPLRGGLATVGEFFGVDVPGAAPAASPGAVVRPEGSKTTNVDQTVDVTINGSELSAEELTRSVRDALSEANERALRVASRALTAVAG